jgi:hypothetical protein
LPTTLNTNINKMKKTLLIVAATLSFGYANAQMKLGNNPTTTNSNALLELETTNKGLLLPRVALTSTTAFAPLSAHVAGMAVYNTATAGDVTPGYYFSDGAKWVKLSDASALQLTTGAAVGKVLTSDAAGNATWQTAAGGGSTLYSADGSLAGNRIVTQAANTLAFTSTATNGFSVDGTTFSVDAANNRVGIGTIAPTTTLDVAGSARIQTTVENSTSIKTVKLAADGTLGYAYQVSAFPTINSSAQDDPIGTTGTFTGTINGNAMTYTMTNKGTSNGGYVAYYDVVIAGTGFGFVPSFVQITPAPSYIGDFLIANVVGGSITATTFQMKIRRLDASTPWSAPTPMGILAIKQ